MLEVSGSADSAKTLLALADILRLKESASEALPLYFKAAQALTKALGAQHADVAYVKASCECVSSHAHGMTSCACLPACAALRACVLADAHCAAAAQPAQVRPG
jgi:hypothetical protein